MAEQKENIKYDKKNYRIHNDRNKELIKKSLEECGTGRSIVLDRENEIIAGNGVYEQAQKLNIPVKVVESSGNELVVVKRTDLKTQDIKRKKLSVLDNSTSDTSEFNIEALENDFGTQELNDFGIQSIEVMLEGEGERNSYAEQQTYGENTYTDTDTEENNNGNGGYIGGSGSGNEVSNSGYEEENVGEELGNSLPQYAEQTERVIVCFQKEDKAKLEAILGTEIDRIIYNIGDFRNGTI